MTKQQSIAEIKAAQYEHVIGKLTFKEFMEVVTWSLSVKKI